VEEVDDDLYVHLDRLRIITKM